MSKKIMAAILAGLMLFTAVGCTSEKNGTTDENELYKLAAVAEHFGTKFARKALIATDLQKNYTSLARFTDRAREMGITVIDGVHKMTESEFCRRIGSLTAQ